MPTRRSEITDVQESLKHLIAARKLKLADLAAELSISIATAKRLLNGEDLSLERVLQICDWLGIRFHELVEIATSKKTEYHFCTKEQETFLANNPSHFSFLRALQKGETLKTIKHTHGVTDIDCNAYLADLEANDFLQITTNGVVKLLVKDGMDWRPDGPLWSKFFGKWVQEFAAHMMKTGHKIEGCIVDISQRKLSQKSFAEMQRELDELSRKYASISRLERELQNPEDLEFRSVMYVADTWTAPLWTIKRYKK